ncbi:MAG TPA: hypothetical protein VIW29_09355 [Polyangiaceae bacterium]
MNARHWASVTLALLSSACTEDQYVLGALCSAVGTCPAVGGGSGGGGGSAGGGATSEGGGGTAAGTSGAGSSAVGPLRVDLLGSGVERLPQELFGRPPTHFLVADDAAATVWHARIGDDFQVIAPGVLELGQLSPFADTGSVLSHAGEATFSADSAWADSSAGALALEAVFRSEPGATLLLQRDGATGLELALDAEGRLSLLLAAGGTALAATSQALVVDAWHHCLALVDASQAAAQIFCNGQAGAAVAVPDGFVVPAVASQATLGGASPARVRWAELARWQAPAWGPRGAWPDQARERFARLVGTFAHGSREPLPFAEVRASGAYIDMSPSDAPAIRRLHPVGEHWPRVVCRPIADSPRECGLLVEADSSRAASEEDFKLENWTATELSTTSQSGEGPTGESSLVGLTPSALATEHTLERLAPVGDGPAVLSLFARSGSLGRVRLEAVGIASATFDLSDAVVLDRDGSLAASAEAWGDGLSRLSLAYDSAGGPGTLRISLLADDSSASFAGDGSLALELGNAELRYGTVSTPLPTFGSIQRADHLVYPAGNGNLPPGPWFQLGAEVWLPAAPLVVDVAVLNANFANRYDQQINLFVSEEFGAARFWGLQGDATQWQLESGVSIVDGALHQLTASVGPDGAMLTVDGVSSGEPAGAFDIGVLDRVDIGKSTSSSGSLTGIVRHVVISAPE